MVASPSDSPTTRLGSASSSSTDQKVFLGQAHLTQPGRDRNQGGRRVACVPWRNHGPSSSTPAAAADPKDLLRSRNYLVLFFFGAVLGVPVELVAFFFLKWVSVVAPGTDIGTLDQAYVLPAIMKTELHRCPTLRTLCRLRQAPSRHSLGQSKLWIKETRVSPISKRTPIGLVSSAMSRLLLVVAAEAFAHSREHLVGEVV